MRSDNIEARHTTPDGMFTLVVNTADDMIGFDDYSWQTHGDLLRGYRVEPKVETVAQFLEALASRHLVMVISRFEETGAEIRNVWITDDPEAEMRCADEGEVLELRYWDGAPYPASRAP